MDIFTTQLTRIVPVPIKPTSLKVKALLKEAANSKLNQDPNHLENHEYYFTSEEDKYHSSEQKSDDQDECENSANTDKDSSLALKDNDSEQGGNTDKNNDKHLDLYA